VTAPDDIADRIRAHVARAAGLPSPPTDADRLADLGYLPSIAMLELVGFLEDAFGIELRPVDLLPEKLATVGQIAAMVRARLAASITASR
jgi:acyl carrier protein